MHRTVFVTFHADTDEVMFTAIEPTTGRFGAHLATCPNTTADVDRIAECIADISPRAVLVAPFPEQAELIQCSPGLLQWGRSHGFAT